MSYEPVRFISVSAIFGGLGTALVYLGITGAGDAGEPAAMPFELPMSRSGVSLPEPLPAVPALPVAAPLVTAPLPVEPQWPATLTYQQAKTNPDYYLAWLQAKNPTIRFKAIRAVVTGYCPCTICCGSGAHGVTRTGVRTSIEPYGIAAPEALVGRAVHIPGYLFESEPAKVWKTDDTGGALNEAWSRRIHHFDVRFINHEWARRWWGRREMTVYISR